jgi:hypothetical protein
MIEIGKKEFPIRHEVEKILSLLGLFFAKKESRLIKVGV